MPVGSVYTPKAGTGQNQPSTADTSYVNPTYTRPVYGSPTYNTGVLNPATYQGNMSSLYPELVNTQAQASANTLSRLRGELSPETLSAIQNQAARFGISSGMPQSGITGSYGRKLLGTTVEGLQSQGLQDYLNALKAYSGTLMPTTGELIGAETSRYGTDVGAATSRYGSELGAETSRYGTDVGALTSRRGQDIAAQTAANALGQQAYQFGMTFPESQRQFDISQAAENQRYFSGLDQNYLNSYLNFLS